MIGRSDGKHLGGVLKITSDMGKVPSTWFGYIYAVDVDARVAAIVADGGRVYMPATDIPHAGALRWLPTRTAFRSMMTPTPPPDTPDMTSDVFRSVCLQRVNWNELTSPDLAASKAFCSKHFDFAFNESMDMGPAGQYASSIIGQRLGGMMQRLDERQPTGWLFYLAYRLSSPRKVPLKRTAAPC